MRRRRATPSKALWLTAAATFALLADVRPAGSQTPFELYRERVAMLATGDRCRLFDADVAAALASGAAQARTAALRGGADETLLDKAAIQARGQASSLSCVAPVVQREAQRVRSAFALYVGLSRMSFPGDIGAWRADRTLAVRNASWMLAQDAYAGQDRVIFGVAGRQGAQAVTVAVSAVDGVQPYAARIVLRDPARAPQAYIPQGHAPLSARAPMRAATRVILAEARAPADRALLPSGVPSAAAFRFPADTIGALQKLDPREAISVEFLYPSTQGDLVRTAFLEVGDFNAGLAFLRVGPR